MSELKGLGLAYQCRCRPLFAVGRLLGRSEPRLLEMRVFLCFTGILILGLGFLAGWYCHERFVVVFAHDARTFRQKF